MQLEALRAIYWIVLNWTKVFIGIDVREIRDCQNRERFKPTKSMPHQVLVA